MSVPRLMFNALLVKVHTFQRRIRKLAEFNPEQHLLTTQVMSPKK